MNPSHSGLRQASKLLGLLSLLALAACAEQRLREQSQADIAAGRFDSAIHALEDGVRRYPESTPLRQGLLQARSEALTQALAKAGSLRAANQLNEAQAVLEGARALDPDNQRLPAVLAELAIQRGQQAAVQEATQLATAGRPEAALQLVAQALKDNPRHAGLMALQRELEAAQRQALLRSAQNVLAEARPISVDFREANLRTVLDAVSRASGINFVLDKDIRQDTRVTVYLRQARVEDALDLIVNSNQLAKKVVDAQTVLIYPNTPEKQRDYQEQVLRVFYLANADAKGAAAYVKQMLRVRDPYVDERTNMLTVRESPELMALVDRLITLYDSPEPEVLLEFEVLEVSATRLTELGIKFPSSISLTPVGPGTNGALTLGNVGDLTRNNITLGLGAATVNLRREVGDFSTLAHPKIRVKNREKAKVLVGDKIPVVTATTGTGGFVSDSVNYLDVGVKLDVEPTVYANDEVAIKVALEVSSLGNSVKTSSGTLAYQIGTRNASTLLRLHDGETQLLAGLISKDERSSASRIPGLGDLPVLGRLFSSQLDNGQRTELVLAITPRILRNVRQPAASETELWVGTESAPKLRPVGGLRASNAAAPAGAGPAAAASAPPAGQAPALAAPTTATLGGASLIWVGPRQAKVGELFELQLQLNAEPALRGMALEIQFETNAAQLLEASEGEFFKQGGATTSFTKSGDGKGGSLRLGVLRTQMVAPDGSATGTSDGAKGKGVAYKFRFKAVAPGEIFVNVLNVKPLTQAGGAADAVLPPAHSVKVF